MKALMFSILVILWNTLAGADKNQNSSFHFEKPSEHDSLANQELFQLKSQIEQNYFGADTTEMNLLLDKATEISNAETKNWQVNYYAGFIHQWFGKFYRDKDEDKTYNHFKSAVSFFHKAEAINQNSELAILLSSAYGKMASLSFFSALSLGGKSQDYLKKALYINNSQRTVKICLVEATHLMFTPAIFGGDKKRAEELLTMAIQLNTLQNNSDSLLISWAGEAEIFAFFAQLYIEKDDYKTAKKYCSQALKLQPEYAFVLYELLPQIKSEGK